ncbi:hypothetical protein LCGC14_1003740 [marine sediment metagenome]|uniref:Glucose-6-phosphate dehydrogenase C-terminal domain-containing protein n=1 Tax=marine sediment metagenome TaxID=412755 RepID=A0A0F9QKL5_9ZZZZ
MSKKMDSGTIITIFGATGDLTKRKLIPALYNLYAKEIIKDKVPIVCVARRLIAKDEFIELLNPKKFIPQANQKSFSQFLKQVYYYRMDLQNNMTYSHFAEFISRLDRTHHCKGNRIFYLALPPNLFESTVGILRSTNLLNGEGWKRAVLEKPFGYDLSSARELNGCISSVFKEDDIYRIDHYLAKEAVQNILALRFANSIFEEIWNNRFIDHVQITVAEKIGVEGRGAYYERAGAIRDMVQNHLLQVLSLASMEPSESLNAEHFRDEKVKVFRSLQRIKPAEVVIGQYGKGLIDKKKVLPYRKEMSVSPNSETETYAALKVRIDNKRWKGVPFYLRTGKRLAASYAEIDLVLKHVPNNLFSKQEPGPLPNVITIRIQPDEGIVIRFNAKYPGYGMNLQPANMEFCHPGQFRINSPKAYETLLYEIILGDQTLFTRWDGVEASWKYIEPVLTIVRNKKKEFPDYEAGSLGPEEADKLIKGDGREWCMPRKVESRPH